MIRERVQSLETYPQLSSVPQHRLLEPSATLEHLRKAVPFVYVSMGGIDLEGYRFGRGRSIDTDMPGGYVEEYYQRDFAKIDPVVVFGQKAKTAFFEDEASDVVGPSRQVEMLRRKHDVGNRFVVPLIRNGIVYGGVCFTTPTRFSPDEMAFLAFSSEPLYWQVTAPLVRRFVPMELGLTLGELTCLTLASHGLTSEGIAANSAYRIETVNSYLKSATRKLGAANRSEAIADAIRRRLID